MAVEKKIETADASSECPYTGARLIRLVRSNGTDQKNVMPYLLLNFIFGREYKSGNNTSLQLHDSNEQAKNKSLVSVLFLQYYYNFNTIEVHNTCIYSEITCYLFDRCHGTKENDPFVSAINDRIKTISEIDRNSLLLFFNRSRLGIFPYAFYHKYAPFEKTRAEQFVSLDSSSSMPGLFFSKKFSGAALPRVDRSTDQDKHLLLESFDHKQSNETSLEKIYNYGDSSKLELLNKRVKRKSSSKGRRKSKSKSNKSKKKKSGVEFDFNASDDEEVELYGIKGEIILYGSLFLLYAIAVVLVIIYQKCRTCCSKTKETVRAWNRRNIQNA